MNKLTIIGIVTALLITLCGCSGNVDNNKPNFDVVGSNVAVVGDETGYSILLAFEVSNSTNSPLYLKKSDFDIVDENGTVIDTIRSVSAYPPIIEPKKTSVYYGEKVSDKISDVSVNVKAIPHIKSEKTNTKLTTLPTPGSGMNGVFVRNSHKNKEYENVQVVIICRNQNDKITGVLTTRIDSIKPGEEIEAIPEGRLIEKDLDPMGGGKRSFFAYIEPYDRGNVEEGLKQ